MEVLEVKMIKSMNKMMLQIDQSCRRIKIFQIRIYYFVIHSLLFGMKFCKITHIHPEDDRVAMGDQNHPPNHPLPVPSKVRLEQISQEEVYRSEIEEFIMNKQGCASREWVNYFSFQREISQHMRGVLLNWLIQVHQKYKLMGQTFFLTVRLIDQYLSVQKIARNRLQLLGITALWVAAKYQETYQVPKIDNLVYICDSAYTPADILAMEGSILLAVRFGLLVESPLNFYQLLHNHSHLTQKDYWLGRYLLEASAFQLSLSRFSSSLLAYSLIFFIKKLRGYPCGSQQSLRKLCGVNESEVRSVARELCSLWQRLDSLECFNGLKTKYSQKQFLEVAKIKLTEKAK